MAADNYTNTAHDALRALELRALDRGLQLVIGALWVTYSSEVGRFTYTIHMRPVDRTKALAYLENIDTSVGPHA